MDDASEDVWCDMDKQGEWNKDTVGAPVNMM